MNTLSETAKKDRPTKDKTISAIFFVCRGFRAVLNQRFIRPGSSTVGCIGFRKQMRTGVPPRTRRDRATHIQWNAVHHLEGGGPHDRAGFIGRR